MGRRGPAPKPATLRVLEGRTRRDLMRKEPKPRRGQPEAPSWLSEAARAEWDRILPDLAPVGISPIDLAAVASYCEAFADYARAVAGRQIDPQDRGDVLIRAKLEARLQAAIRELGLSPASRSRIGSLTSPKEESDALDEMLNQPTRR